MRCGRIPRLTISRRGVSVRHGRDKAKKANGGRRAWPDLFIAAPTWEYHGLFIEIKKNRLEVYGKRGKMRTSAHISEQNEKLESLREKGYAAEFGMGLGHCIEIIDNYLGRK